MKDQTPSTWNRGTGQQFVQNSTSVQRYRKGGVTALSSAEEWTSVPNILSWVELDSSKQLYMPDRYILWEECVAEDLTESKLTLVKIEFL